MGTITSKHKSKKQLEVTSDVDQGETFKADRPETRPCTSKCPKSRKNIYLGSYKRTTHKGPMDVDLMSDNEIRGVGVSEISNCKIKKLVA